MKVSIIVAKSNNNCIGKQNKLPWHLKNDLKYFKKITTGNVIIMGRNTFESIGKPLPNRANIVLSKDANYNPTGVVVRNSIDDALAYAKRWLQDEVFIIGGDTIYKQTLAMANKLYVTQVDADIQDGDAFFPEIDNKKWDLHSAELHTKDEHNDYNHSFEIYLPSTSEPIIYR
jgi:dihydrofolate reductase